VVASLAVDRDTVTLRLSWLEKLGALHGDIRLPRSSVSAVRVTDHPWRELRGIRAPGTGVPGLISLGTRRGAGVKDFAAVYRNRRAVVVEVDGAEFNRLVVSVDEPDAVRRLLEASPPATR
jgi:hypothetical protein